MASAIKQDDLPVETAVILPEGVLVVGGRGGQIRLMDDVAKPLVGGHAQAAGGDRATVDHVPVEINSTAVQPAIFGGLLIGRLRAEVANPHSVEPDSTAVVARQIGQAQTVGAVGAKFIRANACPLADASLMVGRGVTGAVLVVDGVVGTVRFACARVAIGGIHHHLVASFSGHI